MKTTLNKIRKHSPCKEGWKKLLQGINKTKADAEPVSIIQILDSNGLDDALWCLRAVRERDREIRLYAVWCARQVEHLMEDQRSKDAINVAESFANGKATEQELGAAETAAWNARTAARTSRTAAGDTARNAAWAAARGAAGDTAARTSRTAAGDAAWDVARDAARTAAWDAARGAARTSRTAAWDAARGAQEKELRRVCAEIEEQERA